MKRISSALIFSFAIFNALYLSNNSTAIAATSCNTMRVELGTKSIFCLQNKNGEDTLQKRADIIEATLQRIAGNINYKLDSIEVILESIPKRIQIDKPNSTEKEILITILEGDTDSNNKALTEFDSSTLKNLTALELENYRQNLILSQYPTLINESEDSGGSSNKFPGDIANTWLDVVDRSLSILLLLVAITLICLNFRKFNRWIASFFPDPQETHNPPHDPAIGEDANRDGKNESLYKAIKSLKLQLGKVRDEAGSAEGDAMFTLGSATVNLKTVLDNKGNLKIAPASIFEGSSGFSNQRTQDLTLVFNPLKVFSRNTCKLEIQYEKNFQNLPEGSLNPCEINDVTEADFVDIKDKSYLWIRREETTGDDKTESVQEWIDANNIVHISATEIIENNGNGAGIYK